MTEPGAASERSAFARGLSGGLVALGGFLWLLPVGVMLVAVPRFREIFEKFDIPALPAATALVLDASAFLMSYALLLVPLGLIVVAGLAVGASKAEGKWVTPAAAVFAVLSLLGVLICMTLVVLAMFLPLMTLVQTLGGR